MKIMNVEKRILTDFQMDQLLNISANENLKIKDEADGKRCVGYVDIKGQYLIDDAVKKFNEYIECDIFAPKYKCNDEEFSVHLTDVNGYINNGLVVNITFEINGIIDEDVQNEDEDLNLLGLEDLFEENENLYTNCTLVIAKNEDTYESIANRYQVDVNELKNANNHIEIRPKLCILIPKA